MGYLVLAAIVATGCCRRLHRLAFPGRPAFPLTWTALTLAALFLAVTSPETNRFAHCLHTDALAVLVSVGCFAAMLRYQLAPTWSNLLVLSACPALGFLTKQFLISWGGVILIFLVLNNPRDLKRIVAFIVCASAFVGTAIGVCYLVWGDPFLFWTFEVMGGERKRFSFGADAVRLSIPRMVDHVLRAWAEIGIGVVGGWLLLRGDNVRRVGPLWVAWLALVASEAISSGAGWNVLYHFGPGVVLGTAFLFAALPQFWPVAPARWWANNATRSYPAQVVAAGTGVLAVFLALRVVPNGEADSARYWQRRPSADVYRYIADIEKEFEGIAPETVLLDVGNWVYLPHSVLMKDRAISTADQPAVGNYQNLDVTVRRIRERTYAKILVRDLDSPFFLYDYSLWPRPSGVRDALRECYTVVRTIPGAAASVKLAPGIRHAGPVTVLVPKPQT
jgi:hypothetical protein